MSAQPRIAVVVPCYKVSAQIADVIDQIGDEVTRIYIVDDCCPDDSAGRVDISRFPNRVTVVRHARNMGVGAAVMSGYKKAIDDGMDIVVKIDGDGQMDPRILPNFVAPIIAGEADYTKGNRFFEVDGVRSMPKIRIFGNAVLSFLTKLSAGYWDIFDPTNGYTAIHSAVARRLPYDKISQGYFFESDILFRLNILRAVVVDVPMEAKYGDEVSNLKISRTIGDFLGKHIRNFIKRIFYNYYLRDMSLASFELPIGIAMIGFGCGFGIYHWERSVVLEQASSAGTVMLAALPIIVGLQLVLAFIGYDISAVPKEPIHRLFGRRLEPPSHLEKKNAG